MLLSELLQALKQAYKNKDNDAIKKYKRLLNNAGMDNNTIAMLINIY